MRIIAISNQKGGCGKTTTAVNLAAGLALSGYTVCLVDCDPQANATTSVFDRADINDSLTDVVCPRDDGTRERKRLPFLAVDDALYETRIPNLDLLPSNIGLSRFEQQPPIAVDRLVKAIRDLAKSYEFVVVDTPPSLGLLSMSSLKAASHVIIPISASYLALEGVSDLLDTLTEIQIYSPLQILGVLITLYDTRTSIAHEAKQMIESNNELGPRLFQTIITDNTKLSESPGYHVPIYRYPNPGPSVSRAIQQFDDLAGEVLTRLNVTPANAKPTPIKKVK
jgi:chromosome partitioning protein